MDTELNNMKTEDSDLNCEASGESSKLLGKKDESLVSGSLPTGCTSKQYTESVPSTSKQNLPLQEERIEVGFDRMGFKRFQKHPSRIFEVVAHGDDEALSNLLTNSTTDVHSIDSKGDTALHYAVTSACRKGEANNSLYQCIDVLMSCEEMNVNMPNKKGFTAIGLAVHQLHRTCIERMLKHPSAGRLHLDYCPGDRESTVREIIAEIYPEMQPLLPEPLMESLESSDIHKTQLAALQNNKYEVFLKYLRQTNVWYNEPYHSSLLEIACQIKNRKEFVKILLDKGADPNIKNLVTGMPLIHATARSGNFEVLQLLLEKEGIDASLKDHEERTILHWLAGVNGKTGDKEKIEKCFKLLLDSAYISKKGIDEPDSLGNTPLYIAVESGFRDRAKLLLCKGADVRVFESGSKILLPDSMSIVNEILDDSLEDNNKPLTSKDLQLKLNYQSFANIVPRIAERGRHRELLTHPVTSTFLSIKWRKVRYIFFLSMGIYVNFLCSLTAYVLLTKPYNTVNDGSVASNITVPFSFNDSNITSGINDSNFTSQSNSSILDYLSYILLTYWVFLTISQILQLTVHRWVYLKSMENWLEMVLIISTYISCSDIVESVQLKIHSSAIALFLGWSELLLMSGRLPQLSIQKEMLRAVSITFLRYMMSYVTLLIGFALSFYILFKGSSEEGGDEMFAYIPISFLKTIVMFTGEFDASDLSFDTFPYTSHVIFLLFVVLMAIILFNLLNGLAVDDTGKMVKDAETLSLAARAKLISRIEALVNALPKRVRPSVELKEEMFVIYPNRRNSIGSAAVRCLIQTISKKREHNDNDNLTEIKKELRMFQKKFSELQTLQENLQKKLISVLD
jgi:ankyrin repeat protein